MSRRSTIFRMLAVAGGLAALPLTVSGSTGKVQFRDAACEMAGGNCCTEERSTCYPNNCSSQVCAQDNAYWSTAKGPCQ